MWERVSNGLARFRQEGVRGTKEITVFPLLRRTWIASQGVAGTWLRNRTSSTPRVRVGPIWVTATPRRASSFARKSVVSRRPRVETSSPASFLRVPGGSLTSGAAAASPANIMMTRVTVRKHRRISLYRLLHGSPHSRGQKPDEPHNKQQKGGAAAGGVGVGDDDGVG